MKVVVPFAALLAVCCGARTPSVGASTSPPSSQPPPSQDAPPASPPSPAPIVISLPPDAVPWNPAPVDAGGGATRCDRGETLPAPEGGTPCASTVSSLPAPTRVPFVHPTIACGTPVVNAAGTLLMHASVGHGCGYDDEDVMVLQPDLTWAYGHLPHWPLAIGLGADGFLIAGGEPTSVSRIFAHTDATGWSVGGGDGRVPFPLAFYLPHEPWGYDGPWGAWPDSDGGLLVAGTGAELDRTVALGVAHVDATGALVAGPIRVASTGQPLETSLLPIPLAAGVDGAGRMLVVWEDWAQCEPSYATLSVAARWYAKDGAPLGDPFDVWLEDFPAGMLRLADGSLAITTSRGWLAARFADGIRGVGPVPDALAQRDARQLVRVADGYASIEPPCAHPDLQGRVEVLAASGESCSVVALPPLSTCFGSLVSEHDVVVGADGTIVEREPDYDGQNCAFRVWPGALGAP